MSDEHRRDWRRVEGAEGIKAWGCAECEETSATCGTCGKPSGSTLLICDRCLRHTERLLADIDDALSHYRAAPRSLAKSPMAYSLVPGGSVTRDKYQQPGDVEGALWGWVARWSELVGDPSNLDAGTYLRGHHMWAAHNPEVSSWPLYLVELRELRHAARRIAGLLPQRLAEPCPHCGGDVVQDWADAKWQPNEDGLSDVVRCTGCAMTWNDRAHWRLNTKQRIVELPAEHPDAWVSISQATRLFPAVPVRTMRSWAKRSEPDYQRAVAKAQTWWEDGGKWWHLARLARDEAGEAWAWWQASGWTDELVDNLTAPAVAARALPQSDDGRYRVGDLYELAVRWAASARPGPKVRAS